MKHIMKYASVKHPNSYSHVLWMFFLKYIAFSSQRGSLPIHHAAMKGHNEVVKILIDAGSEIDTQDKVSLFIKFFIRYIYL